MPQIKLREPKTDKWKTITISQRQFQSLRDLNKGTTTKNGLLKNIESLNATPKIKSFLEMILEYTIEISSTVIKIGKAIVQIILNLYKNFPKGTLGLIIGFTIGKIISSVPILGWALQWIIVPLATVTGVAIGVKNDIADKDLAHEVKKKIDSVFSGIKDIKV